MSEPSRDSGFTLIELLVTISLLGIMMAIAISGWSFWAKSREQSGTAHEIQSLLRNTQQRAVTEGQSMCVQFDTTANSYTVFKGACLTGDVVQGPIKTDSPRVHLATAVFSNGTVPDNKGVTFSAHGTAWPGDVTVTRDGSSKVYTLTVEGLTGRVSLD